MGRGEESRERVGRGVTPDGEVRIAPDAGVRIAADAAVGGVGDGRSFDATLPRRERDG